MDWETFSFDYRVRQASLQAELVQIEAYKEAALNLLRRRTGRRSWTA